MRVAALCMAKGLIISRTNRSFADFNNTLCLSPALTIGREQTDQILSILEQALAEVGEASEESNRTAGVSEELAPAWFRPGEADDDRHRTNADEESSSSRETGGTFRGRRDGDGVSEAVGYERQVTSWQAMEKRLLCSFLRAGRERNRWYPLTHGPGHGRGPLRRGALP